ncbi:MAG: hypothetical protein ABFD90_12175 [Phycisphaerales bacterium]
MATEWDGTMKCIYCNRRRVLDPISLEFYTDEGMDQALFSQLCLTCAEKEQRRVSPRRQYQKAFYRQPKYRISRNVANAIRKSIRTGREFPWWERCLGYTWPQLKVHLESQFEPYMTWQNYGEEWHIDHIKPVASFEFEDYEDPGFRKCWALKNLRPLWAEENWDKNAG